MSQKKKDALVGNAADEEQVQKADEQEKNGAEKELDDLKSVLDSKSGRALVWRLLSRCGIYEQSFLPGGRLEDTPFHEGKRNIGLQLLAEVMIVSPEKYLLMQNEAKEI